MSAIENNTGSSESFDKKRGYKEYLAKNTLLTILFDVYFCSCSYLYLLLYKQCH